jgi:hypothetical protein
MHLKAVGERCNGLPEITKEYCTALAQIIVTVMEQYKTDVAAENFIAREAYFTSTLFGSSSKEQDGREKKRNFEKHTFSCR